MSVISKSSFSLIPLNESAYELNVQFLNENGSSISEKKFTFLQQHPVEKGKVLDVFTKNGSCGPAFLKHLFQKSDEQFAKKVSAKLNACTVSGPLTGVLDIKEPHTGYIPCSACEQNVAESEEVVCNFFSKKEIDSSLSSHAKKIHSIFHSSLPVDFVICEGTLKTDLLKNGGFTDKEIEYFQNTSSGAISLCQCAEFFMNGLKLGQEAQNTSGYFQAEKFIKPISGKFACFLPYQSSTVFYPALYKDIYSPEGEFTQVLHPVFSVTSTFDEDTKITTLNVEKK
jgi:hypothetical protein